MNAPKIFSDRFLGLAESGMGYQVVRARFANGTLDGVLFNSEIFAPNSWIADPTPRSAARWTLDLDAETDLARRGEMVDLEPLGDSTTTRGVDEPDRQPLVDRCVESPITWLPVGIYGRFGIFRQDHRLTAEGAVLSGTYMTTWDDAIRTMRSGAAHEIPNRYGLPGSVPRQYLFRLDISSPVLGQRGHVCSRFGRVGGGADIFLPFGIAYPAVQGFYATDDGKNWAEHAYP